MWEYGMPAWESALFRKEAINSIGLLDPNVHASADKDFMMKLARRHIFYTSKKPYAQFLRHSNSVTYNRNLVEAVSSLRIISERWLQDEGLSDEIKERIKKKYKDSVKTNIAASIFNSCILGKDKATIAAAKEIMKKEIGLSYRPFRAILIAEVVNSNRFLKRILPLIINRYLQVKNKIILLKKRRKYVNFKTYLDKCENT
jgi:hypothetical protein